MNVKVLGILGLLLVLCGFMAVMTAEPWYRVTGSTFLQPNNVENLLRRTAMYGILGIGVAFVIISSGIDLSIGSTVCLSGCLLAIFLQVEYRPFDYQPILEVRGKAREIVVAGDASAFAAGDHIRYFGGRRARNALLTIEAVDHAGGQSVIRVDQPLTNNDTYGEIARVCAIESFDRGVSNAAQGANPTVVLSGDHGELREHDQVILVSPGSGLKQLPIRSVVSEGGRTTLALANDLGTDFTVEWLAIPLERRQRMSIPAALLSVLGIALGLGLVHGLLVTRMKLPPFVVTLCGLLIYRGISRWLVNDQPVGFGKEFESTLSPLGSGKFVIREWVTDGRTETFGIPYPFFIALAAAVAAAIFLNRTIWGRYLLALGRNEDAARYSGINTGRITLVAYVICTVMAAVGGMLFALDSNSISPSSFGNFFELYAIAAAVLGGCSLRGGEGSIVGVIIGTAVMQVLYNLVVLMKISDTLEFAIIGAVILVGVLADELVRRLSSRRTGKDAR
jgi:ribose transport system permease protein